MTSIEEAFDAVPERAYTHHARHGETLHRSLSESIRRELTSLQVRAGDRVLEIGTGSGYSSAVLTHLCGPRARVTSVDISADLVARATDIHREHEITTVDCQVTDGLAGYPSAGPYQKVVGWCTPPRLPMAWVEQLAGNGRIVTCLPLAALPSITVIATIAVSNGIPHVAAITSGGYVQGHRQPYGDVHMPHRWVDWTISQDRPCWISIAWRDRDDPVHAGARTALTRLMDPGHTETYQHAPLDWNSWIAFITTLDDQALTSAICPAEAAPSATPHPRPPRWCSKGTIIADMPGSASLDVIHTWLTRWERAGRPAAESLTVALIRNDGNDCPGWDLRVSR